MRSLGIVALLCILLLACPAVAAGPAGKEKPADPAVAAFEQRLNDFLKLRNEAEKASPHIDGKSKPEEITAHRRQLAEEVRKRRPTARVGDVFGTELTARIGKVMAAYLGRRASPERRAVEDDKPEQTQTKIMVNGPYPAEGRAMMPPDILKVLPRLPDGLQYRFVQDDLLLVDTRSQLIIDLVPRALP